MARKQTLIPYGHPAGERAYEIMQRIAERLWEQAQSATAAYLEETFQNAKTTREWTAGEEYRREIKVNRRVYVVSYGYRTKEIAMVEAKEMLKQCG